VGGATATTRGHQQSRPREGYNVRVERDSGVSGLRSPCRSCAAFGRGGSSRTGRGDISPRRAGHLRRTLGRAAELTAEDFLPGPPICGMEEGRRDGRKRARSRPSISRVKDNGNRKVVQVGVQLRNAKYIYGLRYQNAIRAARRKIPDQTVTRTEAESEGGNGGGGAKEQRSSPRAPRRRR